MQITPSVATIEPAATQQFTANVVGSTDQTVTWSVNGIAGGNATVGTISSTGLYTAPKARAFVQVTATAAGDVPISGSVAVNVRMQTPGLPVAWGLNNGCQLGGAGVPQSSTPIPIGGIESSVGLFAEVDHNMAMKSDGTSWMWGTAYGPTVCPAVSVADGLTDLAGGSFHTLALYNDGSVWAWGDNRYGQLGNGTYTNTSAAVMVGGLSNVVAVAAGAWHSLALKDDGTVWAWGENDFGQLGNGTSGTASNTPVQVTDLTNVVSIRAGGSFSMALKADGTVWSWGANLMGQLGDDTWANQSLPVQAIGLSGVAFINAAPYDAFAITSDGRLWAWGANDTMQLGNALSTSGSGVPVQLMNISQAREAAGGSHHTLLLKDDGSIWAWGMNTYGQLGDGTTNDSGTPVRASLQVPALSIASGYSHSLALLAPGALHHLSITPSTMTPSPGMPFMITVTAQDASNVDLINYTGTVHFAIVNADTNAVLPIDYTFVATDRGRRTFDVTLYALGPQTITAVDTIQSTVAGSTSVTVAIPILVVVDPPTPSVATNTTIQFTATVLYATDTRVTWAVAGPTCTGSSCGTIDANGLYTAPAVPPPNYNVVLVTARSVQDPTKSGTAAVTITSAPSAVDLKIQIAAPTTSALSADLLYSVTTTNIGTLAATTVSVTHTPPIGLTVTQAVPSQGSCSIAPPYCSPGADVCMPGAISCSLGDLGANATATVSLVGRASAAGNLTLTANTSSSATDADPSNNSASATTMIAPAADLSITESDTNETLLAGATYTYRYTVANNGPSTATELKLTPSIPSGATLRSTSAYGGWACDSAGVCVLNSLASGAQAAVEFSCQLNSSGSYVYAATVSAAEFDPVTANNTTSETNSILSVADVAVTVGSPTAGKGAVHVHTVTITNQGPADASGVVLKDRVSGDVVLSATSSQGSCQTTASSVDCVLDAIAAQQSATITISVQAPASGWSSHSFSAGAREYDPVPQNNAVRVSGDPEFNTRAGDNVSVEAVDTASGASATLTFAAVTSPGTTSVSAVPLTMAAPAGYRAGTSPAVLDLHTTAQFSGAISIVLPFSPNAFRHPSRVRLFHYENGAWVDRTTAIDAAGRISATTASLSPFALFETVNTIPAAVANDIVVPALAASGAAVTLDGSASSDADGDALTYRWTGPFSEGTGSATGAKPNVSLPIGVSRVALVVNDGESNSTATAVNVTVADFSLAATNAIANVTPGGLASYAITVSPKFGAYAAPITLTCAAPTGMRCSFSPEVVVPGATGGTSTLIVSTTALVARSDKHSRGSLWMLLALAMPLGMMFAGVSKRRVLLASLLLLAMAIMSCGGGGGAAVKTVTRQPVTSTVTVTATSAGLSHATNVTVTVE